jgi:hypothetical protein
MSLKSWIIRKLREWEKDYYNSSLEPMQLGSLPSRISGRSFNRNDAIGFYLHKATGGWVVDISHYDDAKGDSNSSLYIITNEDEIGQELTKIISIESLRR